MVMSMVSSFLLSWNFQDPVYLRGLSIFLHLVLLLSLFISWMSRKFVSSHNEREKISSSIVKVSYYRATLLGSLCLAGFNIVLCVLNNFYWYPSGWPDEKVVTFTDLCLKTVSWLSVSVYLHAHVLNSGENKYPIVLRTWWILSLSLSCYCLVIDTVYYRMHQSLSTLFWASDIVSMLMSLFFCFVGFLGRTGGEGEDSLLQEPLLDSNNSTRDSVGEETITPFGNASFFSILTFSWLNPLISLGRKKPLDLKDIPQLVEHDCVRSAFSVLDNKLKSLSQNTGKITTIMLVKGLLATVWKEVLLTGLFALVQTFAAYVGPFLIETLVEFLDGNRKFDNEGYVLVLFFFTANFAESMASRHWMFRLQQAAFRARAGLVEKIYSKGLTLSFQSRQAQSSGEIINLMAVDAERISDFSWHLHEPWRVVLQIVLALILLYKNLGLAFIASFFATVLVMMVNYPIANLQEKFQGELMKSKDGRMKVTSEVLRNMRILKLQAWEMKFLSKIQALRDTEAGWLRKYLYTWAMTSFAFSLAPTFVSVVTFGACFLMGIPLESGKILSALATFKILQEPIYVLPDTISVIVQTKVSLDRITSFLCLADLPPDVVEKLPAGSSDLAIEIVDGNFTWEPSASTPCLADINVSVSRGMRVAICGAVGSGKSSLLQCLLGETPKLSGLVKLCGTKAYVAQSPWIQSGKIEENILFGKEMEREKYDRVLEACSLKKDLEVLSFGDQTVIGERGINLSGGQKQRIQIARALYQDADIYIFDDPFSAVDAHTGTHLFNECILDLLSSKTVVYVTHQMEFLPAADLILVMKDGKILQSGKYDDILKSGSHFMELVGAHREALSVIDSIEDGSRTTSTDTTEKEEKKDFDSIEPQKQLVEEEEREKGKVGFSVYWKFLTTAYGGALVPLVLLAYVLFQVFQVGSNYWMAWATPVSKDDSPKVTNSTLITVYICFAIGCCICTLVRVLSLAAVGYKTSTILFNKMHFSLFRAPMSFFDSTPSGRILNRASTDQSAVDLRMSFQAGTVANATVQLLATIVVMSQVAWQVFIVFLPVMAVCIWLQKFYISSARELSRLIGVCKAPVIQHFSETISGSSTIRSFDQEQRFQDVSMKLIDSYSRPSFNNSAAMEWLVIRIDMLSLITFTFSLIFLVTIPEGTIDPSLAGLAVTYGLSLSYLLFLTVWSVCNMENRIISVERMLQYTSLPSEPELFLDSNRPDIQWPYQGQVVIRDLKVRYAPHLPLVLRGLTCTFLGGKKTGIVGRTGSGKSTLIQTLFRMVEPENGQIQIDGIDISSIGLHDLRSRLSIIPQDPTMFEGTVRSNLDPLGEYNDEQIWEALEKCQLGDEVRKKDEKLDSSVSENGENWSVGQRQLVCLGRVLLKKSKVLVLDEATASVDTATDNLIQHTLRQHFTDSTVITIAHRITSVLNSDIVILLDQGLIRECDTPSTLLEDNTSEFAKLVAEYSTRSTSS